MTESEQIQYLNKKISELRELNSYYEGSGIAKLFYGLNRKAAEMADILNKISLKDLDLTDPKDKTFERLKVIWNDAANIANAVKALEETAGVITNDENKDTSNPIYRKITTPETMADSVGQLAGGVK